MDVERREGVTCPNPSLSIPILQKPFRIDLVRFLTDAAVLSPFRRLYSIHSIHIRAPKCPRYCLLAD